MCCEDVRQAFGASDKCCRDNMLMVKENGKKFTLQLPKNATDTVCCIHVDDCLIQNKTQQKCDYWLRICQLNSHKNYFVEFKGGDIDHAFDQLVATIRQVREKGVTLPKASIHGVILGNNIPRLNAGTQKLKDKFTKTHGADLQLHSKKEVVLVLK